MDDLISRQAAIEHLKKRLYETALNIITEHPYYEDLADNKIIVWLNELPSTERRGRWINENEGIWNAVILPKCSICGETFYEMNVNINGEYPYNYCPNCGARMEAREWTGTKKP